MVKTDGGASGANTGEAEDTAPDVDTDSDTQDTDPVDSVFRVDLATMTCSATGYSDRTTWFDSFGMGYSTDSAERPGAAIAVRGGRSQPLLWGRGVRTLRGRSRRCCRVRLRVAPRVGRPRVEGGPLQSALRHGTDAALRA
jgi:hypothetical protein